MLKTQTNEDYQAFLRTPLSDGMQRQLSQGWMVTRRPVYEKGTGRMVGFFTVVDVRPGERVSNETWTR